ncbi:hypothetical protein GCM10027275_08380 [Rhabdobacter roseus]
MTLKTQLIGHLKGLLDERMAVAWAAMDAAQASANEASKSSAGDKYETARAMGQLDRNMHARQYEQARQERAVLERVSENEATKRVAVGTLVKTTSSWYFIAVSVGAVALEGTTVLAVSAASPVGQVLIGKQAGEPFLFQGKKQQIESIY